MEPHKLFASDEPLMRQGQEHRRGGQSVSVLHVQRGGYPLVAKRLSTICLMFWSDVALVKGDLRTYVATAPN